MQVGFFCLEFDRAERHDIRLRSSSYGTERAMAKRYVLEFSKVSLTLSCMLDLIKSASYRRAQPRD